MNKPNRVGWHWFLPDINCPTPDWTSLIRIDKPVILLVGVDKFTRDMPPARLIVRFPQGSAYVDDLHGDWEQIDEPERMTKEAKRRVLKKLLRE